MKDFRFALAVSALALAFAVAGCDKNNPADPADSTATDDQLSLDVSNGGFTTSDESPAFGDPEIMTNYAEDQDAADPVSEDSQTLNQITDGTFPAYFVRITWGQLQFDSTVTESMDWSGYAEVNKGNLAVLKTIRFELEDYLHLPRDNRQRLDFTSHTSKHFDGLLLVVIDNDTANTSLPGELTIQAGIYSHTFSFAELDSMESLETVDDAGNAVSIISRVRIVTPFAGGFFAGRWYRHGQHHGGFEGHWINSIGTNAGYLRGIWGENRRGARTLFGKYIKMDGTFGGILAGEWGYNGSGQATGWMRGRWTNRSQQTVGVFKAVWEAGRPGDGRGYFHGRWTVTDSTAQE